MARRKSGTAGSARVADERGIRTEDWLASAPTRNPTHGLYISHEGRLTTPSYCAVFAAKKAFETALDGETFKWIDHRTVETTRGVRIKSDQLEEIVEYDFSAQEQEWDFPEKERGSILKVVRTPEERQERNERLGVSNSDDKPAKEPKAKRESKPRPSREGLTTVQDIAKEFGIEPGDARAILRKAKVDKPEQGWAGDDKWAAGIRDIIKKGIKK